MSEDRAKDTEQEVTIEGYVLRFGEVDAEGTVFMPGSITVAPEFAFEESHIDEQGVRVITKMRLTGVGFFPKPLKDAP